MATDEKDKKKDEPTGAKAPDAKADDKTAPIDPQGEADAQAAEPEVTPYHADDDPDPMIRADAAGIGKISPKGRDEYIGLSPGREADPANVTGPDGLPVTTKASTFTRLQDVPFHYSALVKDPASGTYYHPPIDCTGWGDCNLDGALLIPPAAGEPPVTRSKKAAAANGPADHQKDEAKK